MYKAKRNSENCIVRLAGMNSKAPIAYSARPRMIPVLNENFRITNAAGIAMVA